MQLSVGAQGPARGGVSPSWEPSITPSNAFICWGYKNMGVVGWALQSQEGLASLPQLSLPTLLQLRRSEAMVGGEQGQARVLLRENASVAGLSPCPLVWSPDQAVSLPPASLPSSQSSLTPTSRDLCGCPFFFFLSL